MRGTARLWVFVLVALVLPGAAPARTEAPAFQEFEETVKGWKLYCQLWPATRRVECELSARGTNDRSARLVWLRSTERWLDGLRFRIDAEALDLAKPVRVWVDRALFKPEYPCKPFPYETNTCALTDPETNRRLVEKLTGAQEVSVVGQSPGGAKTEVRFGLAGFKAALERMEELRATLGTPWMTQAAPGGGGVPPPGPGHCSSSKTTSPSTA